MCVFYSFLREPDNYILGVLTSKIYSFYPIELYIVKHTYREMSDILGNE